MTDEVVLKIYIVGGDVFSETAISKLRSICDEELQGRYRLEVIDVMEQPQLAEMDKIMAVPTVMKVLPEPIRRVIGDLANRDKVLLGLDLVNR